VEDKYIAQVIATLDHFGQRIFKNGLPQKMRPGMNGLMHSAVGSDISTDAGVSDVGMAVYGRLQQVALLKITPVV
jgi:hypothetical protein